MMAQGYSSLLANRIIEEWFAKGLKDQEDLISLEELVMQCQDDALLCRIMAKALQRNEEKLHYLMLDRKVPVVCDQETVYTESPLHLSCFMCQKDFIERIPDLGNHVNKLCIFTASEESKLKYGALECALEGACHLIYTSCPNPKPSNEDITALIEHLITCGADINTTLAKQEKIIYPMRYRMREVKPDF